MGPPNDHSRGNRTGGFGIILSADTASTAVRNSFEQVWDTMLNWRIPSRTDAPESRNLSETWYGSVALIGGAWTGTVRVVAPLNLCRRIASRLLQTDELDQAQIEDVMRELSNMTAGSFKAQLPGESALGNPGSFTITCLDHLNDGFSPVVYQWYDFEGARLLVAVDSFETSYSDYSNS